MIALRIRVPVPLWQWLRAEAADNGLSTAALVRLVLSRYKSAKT